MIWGYHHFRKPPNDRENDRETPFHPLRKSFSLPHHMQKKMGGYTQLSDPFSKSVEKALANETGLRVGMIGL